MTSPNRAADSVPSYVLDPGMSRFSLKVYSSGLLSSFGHNPNIAIRSFSGEAWFRAQAPEQSSLQLIVDASSLAVTGDANEKDRREIERLMKEEVLETYRYPEIRFTSSAIEVSRLNDAMYTMRILGKLSLHGVDRDVLIPCNVTLDDYRLRANGDFSIRQTEYQIRLVTVAGGALKVKDELKFMFDIQANRRHESAPAFG